MVLGDTCAQCSHSEMCKALESMRRALSSSPFGSAGTMIDDAGDSGTPQDDLDAATLDFSRFRARRMRERLLGLLDTLVRAIDRRDLSAVVNVLDQSDACRCFPADVRDEAIAIAALPGSTVRAPTSLYRYYHMLVQLGDEPMEREMDPTPPSNDGAGGSTFTEIAFSDRRPPRGGPRSGPDRRRSGSR
jgi:hypothetical protein